MTATLGQRVRVEGHYEVRTVPEGEDYVWVPEAGEVDPRRLEELLHPWRDGCERWLKMRGYPEEAEWEELRQLQ
ncbi:MAG: hypothetical protein IN808_07730 [Rubrobacter sp.]|nr:hypothetical protein [Rubrobacter sp.]